MKHPLKIDFPNLSVTDKGFFSKDFDDIYFQQNGLHESHEIYVNGNNLVDRWSKFSNENFSICELGFGLGLNFLATLREWKKNSYGFALTYIGIDKFAIPDEIETFLLQSFPELADEIGIFQNNKPIQMNGFEVIEFPDISLQLILITGEVEIGLTSVKEDSIDAWYLDGFAPSKNPQMWTNELCQTISKLSADGASFSSFTAAGVVRRSLTQNGFIVKKIPGFQNKRHRSCGTISKKTYAPKVCKNIAIIGSGIAGATLAYKLSQKNISVDVFDRGKHPNCEASSGPFLSMYPKFSLGNDPRSYFLTQSYYHAYRFYVHELNLSNSGIVMLATDENKKEWNQKIKNLGRDDLFEELDTKNLQKITSSPSSYPAIKINHGLLLQPKKLISKLLNQNHIKFFGDHEFEKYECHDQSIKLFFHDQTYKNYDGIVFCMGASSLSLFKGLKTTQGKMAGINSSEFIDPMMPINHDCCITPQVETINWIASSYSKNGDDLDESLIEKIHKSQKLFGLKEDADQFKHFWQGERLGTPDHTPIAGALDNNRVLCISGLGSRGSCYAPLLADYIVAIVLNQQLPVSKKVAKSLTPQRYL
ncbi:tRNA (5-methylaminomethyl-2-thiouridine)(34)-methyltransferase MnmD [Pseudomonadota bacterium]|nr:tRNA (5-methylaminomethyl-2-thiouridine)(34)-methyltransferase MnmD [Pseudomonadota bacterium]